LEGRRVPCILPAMHAPESPMVWHRSHRYDQAALPLADRHYNRQKIGSPQFVPPGRCLVLLTGKADALWVTTAPKFVRHAWPNAWMNTLFRNESDLFASALILQAVAATRWHLGEPPPTGMITFVDASKVEKKRQPGRVYLMAGFRHVGFTKEHGLHVLRLAPEDMPPAMEPLPGQFVLRKDQPRPRRDPQVAVIEAPGPQPPGELPQGDPAPAPSLLGSIDPEWTQLRLFEDIEPAARRRSRR